MFLKSNNYIIFNYFKYISIVLGIFIGLIWLSQLIRIIEFQYSIGIQNFQVAKTTLLALPSFINPLYPFLLLIGSFLLNYKLVSSNEIVILKQYSNNNKLKLLMSVISTLMLLIFFINNEIISKKFYEKYKLKELEIRNKLKLGSPSQNEFHIDKILSIYFQKKVNDIYYDVNAIFYDENQFITANSVEIELSKLNFNLVFNEGQRLILNKNEKSKTIFDKFTHTLNNKKYEKLLLDKDHFNTLELIKHTEKDFKNHGHNNIFQYIYIFITIIISFQVIFFNKNKRNNNIIFLFIFALFLSAQIINSYLLHLLNNSDLFLIKFYYFINIVSLLIFYFFSKKLLR